MPRQVTAYACEHGCKRRVMTSKARMEKHESICFHNPERRACQTCANFSSYTDSNGMEDEPQYLHHWHVIECSAIDEELKQMTFDCPMWRKGDV